VDARLDSGTMSAVIHLPFGPWDILLILTVTAMGVVVAYLHHPTWKAAMLSLPLPFTIATVSLRQPVNTTHVTGLVLLFLFTHGVRLLYSRFRVPIAAAIAIPALGYCAAGGLLARILPRTPAAFWTACAGSVLIAAAAWRAMPPRDERGHRSPLPVPVKSLLTIAIVSGLVMIKQILQGFMALFPMVGVLAAYEARHSLWTTCRQISLVMLTMTPMMAACYLVQSRAGLATGLAAGWVVLLILAIPLIRYLKKQSESPLA
jgi:hypothetical protein